MHGLSGFALSYSCSWLLDGPFDTAFDTWFDTKVEAGTGAPKSREPRGVVFVAIFNGFGRGSEAV